MIIWLASYPRSGNTMYRLLLHQVCGWNTYSVYNDPRLAKSGVGELIGQKRLDKRNLGDYARSSTVYFIKTHGYDEQVTEDVSPVIYIVRDPRDTIVSYAHYRKDIEGAQGNLTRIMIDLITSESWGGWANHVKYWTARPKCKTLSIVRFEDMLQWPVPVLDMSLARIKMKCPIHLQNVGVSNFADLHKRWPKFFRKGKVGAWRTEMPEAVEALLWSHYGETAGIMGYLR